MVHILADSGIDQKVQAGTWDEVVTSLSKGIREGKQHRLFARLFAIAIAYGKIPCENRRYKRP